MSKIYPVIIAGGSGTRFWPMSRKDLPKQFLKFGDGSHSLIQATAERMSLVTDEKILVVTSANHAELCAEHLPTAQIVTEPLAKNTAAPIALAAAILSKIDPEALMLTTWSDAAIKNEAEFKRVINLAVNYIDQHETLGLIAVPPEFPNTGYGYIETAEELLTDCFQVKQFREKPDLATAKKFVAAGNFFWNPGIFIWKVSQIINAFQQYLPEIGSWIPKLQFAIGTDQEFEVIREFFETVPSISIDNGILEQATSLTLFQAHNLGWSDIGSWDVWADFHAPDENSNTIQGQAVCLKSNNNMIKVSDSKKLVALYGIDDLIIVDTEEALLVCKKQDAQSVKEIVQELQRMNRSDLL